MHRSRLSMLVIFAAVAACSTRDDTKGTDDLSQDPTLVARLEAGKQAGKQTVQPLPNACTTVAIGAQPSDSNRTQAEELTRQAYDAEMQGNVQQARTLLVRASALDATNKSAAYHLGLTSETLGDRAAAVTAYCRYLALAPTSNEAAEARQRVAKLSQAAATTTTRVAAGSVSERAANGKRVATATTRRVTSVRRAAEPGVVASKPRVVDRPAARGTEGSPAASEPVVVSREAEPKAATVGAADSAAAAEGEVVAAARPVPPAEQPPTEQPTVRRGPNRAQSAGIGAAIGGIIGAATGRSVKSAIIGAAAGGIFGTAAGSLPIRGINGRI